jgi:hypothetical protein
MLLIVNTKFKEIKRNSLLTRVKVKISVEKEKEGITYKNMKKYPWEVENTWAKHCYGIPCKAANGIHCSPTKFIYKTSKFGNGADIIPFYK